MGGYPDEREVEKPKGLYVPDSNLGQFVHLHCHTNLSFRDSINNVTDMARWAAILGFKALAVTDHGHLFSSIRHAIACKEVGISPIFGMEAYEAKPHSIEGETEEDLKSYPAHLTLLVMNEAGWRNICSIHTKSHLAPYARKSGSRLYPRVTRELIEAHSEGIICMSACLGGKVQQEFTAHPNDDGPVLQQMKWYREVFGDRYYVELMGNSPEQKAILYHQRELCRKVGVPTVATNDVHYLMHKDGRKGGPHNVFSASRFGLEPLASRWAEDETRADGETNKTAWYGSDEFYLKTPEEMRATGFTEHELARSLEIASRCIGSFDPTQLRAPIPDAPLEKRSECELMMFDLWRKSKERILL